MKATRFYTLLALLLMAGGVTMQAQQWELDFGDQNDINQHSRIDAGMIDTNEDAVLIGRFGFAGNAIVYGCRSVEERQLFHSRYFKIRHNND